MSNYEDDEIEEVEGTEPEVVEEEPAATGSNRNFLLALGILGGVFVLLIIGLVILFLSRQGAGGSEAAKIAQTNAVIETANAQTAEAATLAAAQLLTPSATFPPTFTPVPPTATRTLVVAATATNTLPAEAGQGGIFTATPSATLEGGAGVTGTPPAALTQSAGQTQTRSVGLTATATRLPNTGFAEDVGLPGLFGMALGLVILIVLVRRLRLSASSN